MIYNDEIQTLADLVRVQAHQFPECKALIFKNKALTYLQLDVQSKRVANALLELGIQAQSRVALLAKDSLKSYEIFFACSKINAVLVPINWRLAAAEVSYILRDANVEVLFVGPEFHTLVESIRDELDGVRIIIALEKAEQNWLSYDVWWQQHSDVQPDVTIKPNDVAVQIYTSGTTGRPKGVQLAHYSFFAIAKEFVKQGKSWIGWSKMDKSLLVLPFFHIGGLWWAIRGLASGAENILLESFDGIEVLKAIEKHRITKTCMVPAMIQVLLTEPLCKQTDFSSLEYIVYGGSPIAESLLKEAMATFSCNFVQIYGMTETGNCAVCLSADEHISTNSDRLKAAGRPFPGVSVTILNSDGETLPCRQVGEICIKSPANMIGYWKLPEATAKTLVDGWVYTGDAGYFDEEGYIYICDRVKDMICYAGENVYPAEVENVLYEHPAVAEVAVIGVPDEDFGEIIKAIIVIKPGMKVTALDIISFVRGKLADFKLPRSVEFTESLPRTPSGKLQKGKLREQYWQGYQRHVN
ncbi:MAG: fatty acid--CoA ligase [Scytonema sp. PMC 1069.18]|nr:fatty acid--CoA ligase [Scytonema sp. PMC 1069.18]MEC4883506.1 fatty acid--CoA ligase [Scytonema sp. PMC 1070.18]